MAGRIQPLDRSWLPELSRFLKAGFAPGPNDYAAFAEEAVLDWKFFQPRGLWNVQRSLGVVEGEKLLAHLGVSTTDIRNGSSGNPIPAIHLTDWLTSADQGSLGAMLMLKAFGNAPVQYTFGCTESAKAVLLRVGYREIETVPLYHKILRPLNSAVWQQLHGRTKFPRTPAYRLFDYLQNLRGSLRKAEKIPGLSIRQTTNFGSEVIQVINACELPIVFTSRSPELLNYYLAHPHEKFKGWLIEWNAKTIGFALTCTVQKPGVCIGRIVELFMVDDHRPHWTWALRQLKRSLQSEGCDLLSCYGSTPWFADALLAAGFFRRGKTPLYLRDPKKLIEENKRWHLTHFEADLSII